MNTNAITTDMISRRLGGAISKPTHEDYAADEPAEVILATESKKSSGGFIIMMLLLFALVAGGTYVVAGVDITLYEIKLILRNWQIAD